MRRDDVKLGEITWYRSKVLLVARRGGYQVNRRTVVLAFEGEDAWEAYGRVSVNVLEISLGDDEFIVGHDVNDDALRQIMALPTLRDTGRRVDYGMVSGRPVLRIIGLPQAHREA